MKWICLQRVVAGCINLTCTCEHFRIRTKLGGCLGRARERLPSKSQPYTLNTKGGATNLVTGIWTGGRGLHKSGLVTCESFRIFKTCLPAGNPRSRGTILIAVSHTHWSSNLILKVIFLFQSFLVITVECIKSNLNWGEFFLSVSKF